MSEEKNIKKKKSKIAFFIVMAIAEVLVLGVIFSYAYVLKQYSKIQRPDYNENQVVNTDLSEKKLAEMRGYRNIAIFGVDSRDNSVGKGNRSDVIIICSIDQDTKEIKLVSIYRDTYLNIGNNSYQKCNHAYSYGGPAQAVKMLNDNLDLNITDYITFNWKAVATAINILGGVDVEITKPEFGYINSYITETVKGTGIGSVQLKEPGMHHLDGVQAVAYARLRYMDTDYQRTERQRLIIELAFEKAKKADLKTLNDLLGNMLSMVATNLTWQDGLDVINDFGRYKLGETEGFPVSFEDMRLGTKGFIVVPTNLESNVLQLHKFLFDDSEHQVSAKVKKYGERISSDTGYYKEGDAVKHVKTSGGYKSDDNGETKRRSSTEETTKKKSVDIYTDNNGRYYQLDKNGETVWLENEDGGEYYTDGAGNKYYIHGNDASSEGGSQTGTSSGGTVTVGPGETTTSRNTNVEIHTSESNKGPGETTTVPRTTEETSRSIGPGETTTAPRTTEESSRSIGPGETTKATVEAPPTTVEPTTARETTVAPVPNGPGSGNVQTAEPKPE